MESCSLHSATLTTIPSSLSQNGFIDKTCLRGQVLKVSSSKRFPHVRKLGVFPINAQASGSANFSSKIVKENSGKVDLKDENVAFVAGATGKVGSRAVRELLKLGFQVRAGVRSAQRAETLVQSVKQMKLESESPSQGSQPVEKLEIVECDLEKQDQIGPALGNASVVLCCIGASEKEIFDVTGPYRIDYLATKYLIEAATVAKVNHFILLTSLGTSKIGFPAAILNLFWGVLYWKRKAEEALIASGLPYTIVRPGGMERPTDAYKETHNITLSPEDTLFGGQVSNLQVAELMAYMAKNSDLSYFKVVEVVAETTAPLTPIEELLEKIPSQRAGIYSPKKFVSATNASDPEPSKSAAIEKPSTPSEGEPAKAVVLTKHSSSPYIAYEDLKPPTSPTPAPPRNTVKKASDIDTMPVAPAASHSQEQSKTISDVKTSKERAQNSDHCHSPYPAYDNFKPPSSPSPSPPSPSLLSTPAAGNGAQPGPLSVNSTVELPTEDTQSVKEQHTEPKPQPQSPFTMYEDLKPPASPIPSFKKS